MKSKEIVSFPAGKTYEMVQRTGVHTHALKRGFPREPSPFLMLRKKGGVMDYIFRVCNIVDLNPEQEIILPATLSDEEKSRLLEYIGLREKTIGFKNKDCLYRFYILEVFKKLDPPLIRNPNPQGYLYYSLGDVGNQQE